MLDRRQSTLLTLADLAEFAELGSTLEFSSVWRHNLASHCSHDQSIYIPLGAKTLRASLDIS
jgi:hypothetical protein